MVVAAAVLACGYLGYGRWLTNKWGVDKEALTPVSYTHLDVYKRQRRAGV